MSKDKKAKNAVNFREAKDEAKLQAHLLNLELKDEWGRLKKDKQIIERNLKSLEPAVTGAATIIKKNLEFVGRSLLESYKRITSEIGNLYTRKT
ncbi:MAG: hypothetical protein AB7F59_12165 [Bdellovibrionales bacterium]